MNGVTGEFLNELRRMSTETEWLEFKRAGQTFSFDQMAQYVSALANEANLHRREEGWLVMGIDDRLDPATGMRPATGTEFARSLPELNRIRESVAAHTAPPVVLHPPHELEVARPDGAPARVLLWRIPAAPRGVPVSCKGHYWGRNGERLCGLPLHKLDTLRAQSALHDWSAAVVTQDWALLSAPAIARARELYARRYASKPDIVQEMRGQTDAQFLHSLRLAVHGGLTRAALVLLGLPPAASQLGGPTPRISWQLLDHRNEPVTHQHFGLPLLSSIDALIARIRIIEINILPPREVAPLNLPNYDDWVLREALHNCVAHQDYTQGGRILVTEGPDTLRFFNYGEFLPGSLDKVLHAQQPEQRYRNACLADAMVELDLMETLNRGVKGMFRKQKERFFPLPDFDIEVQPASVSVMLYGRVLDKGYVDALMTNSDLSLEDAVLLDQIQKGRQPPAGPLRHLRAKGLVEGRSPKLRISAQVAVAMGQEVAYLNQRRPDGDDYKTALCKLLTLGPQPRAKVDELLLPKLQLWIPDLRQRKEYVRTLLKEMTKEGRIQNIGGKTKAARWALASDGVSTEHPQ